MAKKKILIIDDEQDHAQLIKLNLERSGLYEGAIATDGNKGIEMASSESYDVFLVDFVMPDLDGVQTCKRIKEICSDAVLVIMSGKIDELSESKGAAFSDEDGRVYVIDKMLIEKEIGKVHYLCKPFEDKEALEVLDAALAERN